MDSAQEVPSQENEFLAGDVMESLGEPSESGDNISQENEGAENTNDPLFVQKRLKQQKRAHEREMRAMHSRIEELQSMVNPNGSQDQQAGSYQPQGGGGTDEQIHKAVAYALQHRDMEERKAKEAHQAAHVERQYQDLHRHLDKVSDKYEDFDDVVRAHDVPITSTMRDAALLLPHEGSGSAGEVLYHLGKNRETLERIAKLHPLEQARELNKLSRSLEMGGNKMPANQSNRPLGNIKSNPVVNSHSVTEKTSVSDLRKLMKAGWK